MISFFSYYVLHQDLHSFPTRRSSDLAQRVALGAVRGDEQLRVAPHDDGDLAEGRRRGDGTRSEEHTSELQSRLHLVCRLLLEKKKRGLDDSQHRAVRRGG